MERICFFKGFLSFWSDWGRRNWFAFDGMGIKFFVSCFCSKCCLFCGVTSISQNIRVITEHWLIVNQIRIESLGGELGSGSDLEEEMDLYLVWQLLLSYLCHCWENCTMCVVALLPERRLRFMMICSHGVWWAIIIVNQLRYLWKVFYMRLIDRYTYLKRSIYGWLDGRLLCFYNISRYKW